MVGPVVTSVGGAGADVVIVKIFLKAVFSFIIYLFN